MSRLRLRSALGTLLAVVLLGAVAGSIWMLLVLFLRQRAPWLALPVAVALGWIVGRRPNTGAVGAAVAAGAAMLLATLYVRVLFEAALIGASMGMGLPTVLARAGWGMMGALTWMAMGPRELGLIALAVVLAAAVTAVMAMRRRRVR